MVTQDVPASPTLTNPDLILPEQYTSSSPAIPSSPTYRHDYSISPTSTFTTTPSGQYVEPHAELGIAKAVVVPTRVRPQQVSPAYEDYEHGAPLSVIGEEETPKSRKSRRGSRSLSPVLQTSPTPVGTSKHKRLSDQSISSNGSDVVDWENFDTSKILNARLAADLAKVDDDETDFDGFDSRRNSRMPINTEEEMALLNEKAERILENARKRLTHMEDNLTKARHSVLVSPRSSPNTNQPHQPVGGLYRSISQSSGYRKAKPLYPLVKTSPAFHTRGASDSTTHSGLKRLSMISEIRSASALEYGNQRDVLLAEPSSPKARFANQSPASSRSFNSPLRVLAEEGNSPSTNKTSPDAPVSRGLGLGINTFAAISREGVSTPQFASSPPPLVRSASQTSPRSTRELREQMSDLKARISDLRTKAQADSLRRRSLQSLRSPSEFTNAQTPEQWYTSAPEYKETGSPLNTNAGMGWSPSRDSGNAFEASLAPVTPNNRSILNLEKVTPADSHQTEGRTDVNTSNLVKRFVDHLPPRIADDHSVIQESHYEDASRTFEEEAIATSAEEQVYLNEVLEESLQDAEPGVPEIPDQILNAQNEERHEDRLDAFDYENMFLHSAMGNYGGQRSRLSSESGSVETRRAAQRTPEPGDIEEGEEEQEGKGKGEASKWMTTRDASGVLDTDEEAEALMEQNIPFQFWDTGETSMALESLPPPSHPWLKAARSNSMDSVTTSATFATATEGDAAEEDDRPDEMLNWGYGLNFMQPSATSAKRNARASTWQTPPMSARVQSQQSQAYLRSPLVQNATSNGLGLGIPTPPSHSPGPYSADSTPRLSQSGLPRPVDTEVLMEALIKLANPEFKVSDGGSVFDDLDKDLVVNLLRSAGSVIDGIRQAGAASEVWRMKVLRRGLDDARAVLEQAGAE